MNAPTAPPYHTTPKTQNTSSAKTVESSTPLRIDDFIKQRLKEARSENGSGIIESATRVEALGFANSANVRYSEFLKLFQNSTQLTDHYQKDYPTSLFLPWAAFHALLKAMDLWVDLPQNYLGAVPSEQIPWMEIFELHGGDAAGNGDVEGMLPTIGEEGHKAFRHFARETDNPGMDWGFEEYARVRSRYLDTFRVFWKEAKESFFVVAPKEAFSTKFDWLARFKTLYTKIETEDKIPPNDPLVVRFCRGGVLVVAAWGDEAAFLNQAVRELSL